METGTKTRLAFVFTGYALAVLVGVLAVGPAAFGAGNKLPVFTAAQVAQMLVADNPPVSITLHNKTDRTWCDTGTSGRSACRLRP